MMKQFRNAAFSALLALGAFSAVTYTACNKDECKDVVCSNGGTCSGGNCTCPTGYTGSRCESIAYIGNWKGSENCTVSGALSNINITVASSSNDSASLLVSNIGGFGAAQVVTGNLSSDRRTLTFTNVDVGSSRTLSGTFILTSNTQFSSSYIVTPTVGASESCTGTYTKQ